MKKTLLFMMLCAPSVLYASDSSLLVIKVNNIEEVEDSRYLVKMENGDTVTISRANVDDLMTKVANKVREDQESKRGTGTNSNSLSRENVEMVIKGHCQKEWPSDFRMQKYCIEQQNDGVRGLASRRINGELAVVRAKCAEEWPDDFRMWNYCEEQQTRAYQELRK